MDQLTGLCHILVRAETEFNHDIVNCSVEVNLPIAVRSSFLVLVVRKAIDFIWNRNYITPVIVAIVTLFVHIDAQARIAVRTSGYDAWTLWTRDTTHFSGIVSTVVRAVKDEALCVHLIRT